MQSTPAVTRRRPKLQTTVAAETYSILDQIGAETGLPTLGVTIDYIVRDWTKLKRAALADRAPIIAEPAR